jgi:hypothetical protein
VEVEVALTSHQPVHRIHLLVNGEVAQAWDRPAGVTSETFRTAVTVPSEGWVAARGYSRERDSFLQELYAHTSPVYFRCDTPNAARPRDAHWFVEQIDEALDIWIGHQFRYANDRQRQEVRELFLRGREVYGGLAAG